MLTGNRHSNPLLNRAKSLPTPFTYGAAATDPDPELNQELALSQGLNSRSSD